jgi:hypothetical protein
MIVYGDFIRISAKLERGNEPGDVLWVGSGAIPQRENEPGDEGEAEKGSIR